MFDFLISRFLNILIACLLFVEDKFNVDVIFETIKL